MPATASSIGGRGEVRWLHSFERARGFDSARGRLLCERLPRPRSLLKAATRAFDITLFEAEGVDPIDADAVTQKERRRGKRGLMQWIIEAIGDAPLDYFEFGVMDCKTFNRVIEMDAERRGALLRLRHVRGPARALGPGSAGKRSGSAAPRASSRRPHAPAVYDARATLFKGLFQDTLPDALDVAFPAGREAERPLLINIDSDLYSSALFALTSMHPLLRAGDHVYFDEFFDALNEFAAFNDYIRAYNAKAWFVPVASVL